MRLNRLLGLFTAFFLAPIALPSYAEEAADKNNDNDTRVYVEAYGFFPLKPTPKPLWKTTAPKKRWT